MINENYLSEVMTLVEAATEYGIVEGTLRAAIKSNRIKPWEYRKAGRITLILRSAVEREYGRGNK